MNTPKETTTSNHSAKKQSTAANQIISDEVFMATESTQHMPETVARQYLKVKDNRYHFKKSPDDLAFIDKGNKLETPSDSHMVAETLVRVAERRGWDEIRITGSEKFRRDVWYEAAQRGISVRGYTPTEVDKAKLAEFMAQQHKTPTETDKSMERARAYLTEPPAKALEKAPELAGAFAARAAIQDYLTSTHLTKKEQTTVLQQIDDRMVADLQRGYLPKVRKKEHEQETEEELER